MSLAYCQSVSDGDWLPCFTWRHLPPVPFCTKCCRQPIYLSDKQTASTILRPHAKIAAILFGQGLYPPPLHTPHTNTLTPTPSRERLTRQNNGINGTEQRHRGPWYGWVGCLVAGLNGSEAVLEFSVSILRHGHHDMMFL